MTLVRLCDGKTCNICLQAISAEEEGVRLTVPTKKLANLSASTLKSFRVKWNPAIVVDYAHFGCWESLLREKDSLVKSEQTVLREVEDYIERFSPYSVLQGQVAEVVKLLLPTERIVAFTGAGVSASAGLATYRGADGIDTLSSLAKSQASKKASEEEEEEEEEDVDYTKLQPTFTHQALVKLYEMNKLRYCATQNCDNLHQKAGLPVNMISDLHGNVFVEFCEKCFTQYERDYCVDLYSTNCYEEDWYKKCPDCGLNHYTGRLCEKGKCKGKLQDTIVNFKDDLHEFICGGYRMAKLKCKTADVCLCLGSSLSVYPAADLPMLAKSRVIVNLQATELEEEATIRVWATTDDFFQLLLPALEQAMAEPKRSSAKSSRKRKAEGEEERNDTIIDLSTTPVRSNSSSSARNLVSTRNQSKVSHVIDLN